MSWFSNYIKSSVGAKHIMAITGLALVGFVLAHMAGNLQIFIGQEAVIGLIVVFLVHVFSAFRLVSLNRAARPIKYKRVHTEESSFASRAMGMSGIIVLAFLAFHLMHFTLGGGPFSAEFNLVDEFGRHDVYNMTVKGFTKAPVAISYVVAMLLFCLHLKHGVTSMFQSLGLDHPKFKGLFNMAGPAIALIVLVGNCSMPIACLAGWIKVAV
jgi:succinate dehydrogenase / fumarate reductase cytochrome b subunit